MKIERLDEVTKEKEREKKKTLAKSKETYGLEFIPSKETLDAIEDAIELSKTEDGAYDNFDDLWKDLMLDED